MNENLHDREVVANWKKIGNIHQKEQEDKPSNLLAISFKNDPNKQIRDILKKMKFRWNSFRKEFCGYGCQRELETLLKESEFSIEIIP